MTLETYPSHGEAVRPAVLPSRARTRSSLAIVSAKLNDRDYPLVLEPIAHLIPPNQQPDQPMQLSVCVKDGTCRLSSGMIMARSRELARTGEGTSRLFHLW